MELGVSKAAPIAFGPSLLFIVNEFNPQRPEKQPIQNISETFCSCHIVLRRAGTAGATVNGPGGTNSTGRVTRYPLQGAPKSPEGRVGGNRIANSSSHHRLLPMVSA
jgi:hypothetical protein